MRDVSSQSSFDLIVTKRCCEIKTTVSLIPSASRLCELRHTIWVIGRSQLREDVIRPHVRWTSFLRCSATIFETVELGLFDRLCQNCLGAILKRPALGLRRYAADEIKYEGYRLRLTTNLRQSVAKSINGMSHQDADAQNEARSHNSRKHERSPLV